MLLYLAFILTFRVTFEVTSFKCVPMIENISVTFFLDASRPNTSGKCLLKLNIFYKPLGSPKSYKKRYGTNIHLTPSEWEKLNGQKLKNDALKDVRTEINTLRTKAEKIIDDLKPFSFTAFENEFFNKEAAAHSSSLIHWFERYITTLKSKGQIGNAIMYNTTKNSINGFRKNLLLHDITSVFVADYEHYLTEQGKSATTTSIYLRQLRAIINQAIDAGVLAQDKYPFRKMELASGRNIKKALPQEDLKKLLDYKPLNKDEEKALDFWVFSYLCSGMNFADIIELKPENIKGNTLSFRRVKTKRTKKNDLRPITIGLPDGAKMIIEKWKNINPDNPFLFPILEAGLSPVTVKHRCQRFIKWVNKRMETIRQDLEIEHKLGTYSARHSYATLLKRKNVPLQIIKETMGHSSEATTERYLDSFTDDAKMEVANLLTLL